MRDARRRARVTEADLAAGDDLAFAGVARQAELLAAGAVTSLELVELYLRRIDALDGRIGAFTRVLADSARAEAARAQEQLDAGRRAPLLGVPIAVKDNVDVAGEVTSHGTGAVEAPATSDSEVVRRLREAGAVVLGKTTLPELAQWGHFTSSITWGTTRNPWSLDRSPGGSSGGSAAAVAAGMAAGAIGSDGGISIRVPAGACNLFGLKPQRGRISLMPDARHWHGLTMLGSLTHTVLDNALLLDALAGPAPGDADTPPPPERSFVEAAGAEPGRLRIAASLEPVLNPMRPSADARDAFQRTAALLRELGHEVVERDPKYPQVLRPTVTRYLSGVAEDAARLAHPERLERRTRTMIRLGRLAHGRELRRSLDTEERIAARLAPLFAEHDVLLTPLVARAMPPAERWHDRGAVATFAAMGPYTAYTSLWNHTGQPAAAVPAGLDRDGLPIGVQLVGRPNDEGTLLALAAQLEEARPWADLRPPL